MSQFHCGGVALLRPLAVLALVGHYPTNKLIARRSLPRRTPCGDFGLGSLTTQTSGVLAVVSHGYPPPRDRSPTCYSPVRHFPPNTRY